MTWLAALTTTPAEGSGAKLALAYLVVALAFLAVVTPLAFLVGRGRQPAG
jgi:hypothetical protein